MCVEMKCKARCSLQLSQLLDTTYESNHCLDYDILFYMSVIALHLSTRFKKHVSERNCTGFYSGLTLSNILYLNTFLLNFETSTVKSDRGCWPVVLTAISECNAMLYLEVAIAGWRLVKSSLPLIGLSSFYIALRHTAVDRYRRYIPYPHLARYILMITTPPHQFHWTSQM